MLRILCVRVSGDNLRYMPFYSRDRMQCALKRFGPGVANPRSTNTAASKEMQDKLAKMKAEREKQDTMWDSPKETQNIQHK